MDIAIIGLDRIYNGKAKLVNLINPKNLKINVEYFDSKFNIIEAPIEIGEYTVIAKSENIQIKKKLVIKKKDEAYSNQLLDTLMKEYEKLETVKEEKEDEEDIVNLKEKLQDKIIKKKHNFNRTLLRLIKK